MRGSLSRAAEIYNYIEVGLWPTLGAAVAVLAMRRRGAIRLYGLIAAVFGLLPPASGLFLPGLIFPPLGNETVLAQFFAVAFSRKRRKQMASHA